MRQDRSDSTRNRENAGIYYYGGKTDWLLLFAAFILAVIGTVFIFELTRVEKHTNDQGYYAVRQSLFGICGVSCAIMISKLNYRRIAEVCGWFFSMAIVLVVLLQIPGLNLGHFFTVGDMTISVPLLLMPVSCLMLAKILDNKDDFIGMIKVLGYWMVSLILFVAASDYKGALCFSVIVFIMLFVKNTRYALLCGSIVVTGGALLIGNFGEYSWQRIAVWLDPFSDPNGRGYESIASMYTMASGGAFGVGLGDSKAACYLADAKTTYVMAGIIREIGWIGAMLAITLYFAFLVKAVLIACRARDRFGFYLATVITVRFAVMLVLNLFVTVNLVPAIRISLPFISYGGSSLAIDFMLVGVLLSISRYDAV